METERVLVALPGDATAAAEARTVTRAALEQWGLPEVLDDALLVVSELTSNSYRHGRPPFYLSLTHEESVLNIEVHDDGDAAPVIQAAPPEQEGGRGLQLVAALTEALGVTAIPDDGKVVTAVLRVP
jgi:anti-sigma regulatory factor (Ser/Thr protein kinase)